MHKFKVNNVVFMFLFQLSLVKLVTCHKCNSSAIEHFFNVIFTEFQNVPPSCVCVQMCPEQATYCYPNNCFKLTSKKRNDLSKIQGHTAEPFMFIVDHDKDMLDIFKEHDSHSKGRTERPPNEFILRPNPFKELVLKHKRLPKLEMRYNLREQVKNTKSDKLKGDSINLSKTRWPMNKQVFHSKQPRSEIKHFKGNEDTRQTKFFASMFSEHEPVNYTPKYLNKYLTKRDSGDVNLEALYLYKTDSANFSLETLIDSMIESSLDDTINPKLDLSIYMNNSNDSSRKVSRNADSVDVNNTKTNEHQVVDVVSLNAINETIDRNKYTDDLKVQVNQSVIDMIEKMSDEIDKQNNISFKIVEKITGSKLDVIFQQEPFINIHNVSEVIDLDKIKSESGNITNHKAVSALEKQEVTTTTHRSIKTFMTVKTKRQRIVRKLRNRKH